MAKKPKPPEYSKYQQWCDAGKPYWTGVGLANAVTGFAHLKRTLNARESPYNKQKLEGFLYEHMRMVPAQVLKEEEVQAVRAAESAVVPPTNGRSRPQPVVHAKAGTSLGTRERDARLRGHDVQGAGGTVPGAKVVRLKGGTAVMIDNAISRMGPEVPKAWSDSKLVLPDFAELPDVLKKARLVNNERRRKASMLHDQLAEGIEDPILRRDVIAEIVELMDSVSASYDLERDWKLNDHTPNLPEDTRAQLEKMELYDLKLLVTNSISPRVSRWRSACKLRDGDHLVEAKLRLAEAEADKAVALDVLRAKTMAHRVALEQRERERAAAKASKRKGK